jgi:hypothetical protein
MKLQQANIKGTINKDPRAPVIEHDLQCFASVAPKQAPKIENNAPQTTSITALFEPVLASSF